MMKPILGMAILLGAACALSAQQPNTTPNTGRSADNAAAPFSDTSAAQVNLFDTSASESRSFSSRRRSVDRAPGCSRRAGSQTQFYLWQSR
jgi:hypothetical protein